MKARNIYRLVSLLILLVLVASTIAIVPKSVQAAPLAAAATVTLKPVVDSYVRSDAPTTNYGTSASLRADQSPIINSYLRFNVSSLSGITNAKLRIYASSASTQGLVVHAVSDDNWGENTLVYNNAPAPAGKLGSSPAVVANKWVTVNVSSYITGNGMFSFQVSTPGSTAISLAARESGANSPQLVVTYGNASATATPIKPTATPIKPTATPIQPTATTPSSSDWQPAFPIRAAFYYPWFPEAWEQQGIYPYTNYTPTLGYYSARDLNIVKQHITMMQYGHIDAAIASWWGQGDHTDAKVAGLLSASAGTNFRWSLYYENESTGDPSVTQIRSDLTYIRDRYGNNPNFLRVNGKFVVFVYAAPNDLCGMADRWKQANTVGAYVILKVFPGFANCASQPNEWHQYCPAEAVDQQGQMSYVISPGFWLKGNAVRLNRDITRWNQNVRDMVASGARWQLITTFNEWGEGTIVEPAAEWPSSSGYGQYLDALHANP